MAYSEDDYNELEGIALLANVFIYAYLGICLFSMLFRKFIGLELASLFQLAYLSLIQNQHTSLYLEPILNSKHIFGYNDHPFTPLPAGAENFSSPYRLFGY